MVGGFDTVAFCEIDKYCQRVLKRHFPETPIIEDVHNVTTESLQRLGVGRIDCICGGFPCQDISGAGRQSGIKIGTRSGLFFELMRVVRLVRPRFVVLENVAALLANGMDIVLRELSQSGYDAEWQIISCAEVGGVHKRERVFIIAYSDNIRCDDGGGNWQERHLYQDKERFAATAHSDRQQLQSESGSLRPAPTHSQSSRRRTSRNPLSQTGADSTFIIGGNATSYANDAGLESPTQANQRGAVAQLRNTESTNTNGTRLETRQCSTSRQTALREPERQDSVGRWQSKTLSNFCGGNDGFSSWMDRDYLMCHSDLPEWLPKATDTENVSYRKERLQALGNAICPQQASVVWQRVKLLAEL